MKKKENLKYIASFNCQGLVTSPVKLTQLADDFESNKIDILAVQETHIQGLSVIDITSNNNNTYKLYNCGNDKKSIYGIGIVVHPSRTVEFDPIRERICRISTAINNGQKLNVLRVYAPTLEVSEANP